MELEHAVWRDSVPQTGEGTFRLGERCQMVLAFGSGAIFADPTWFTTMRRAYPQAKILGCSTAGEISRTRVHDDSVVTTAVAFDRPTRVEVAVRDITRPEDSHRVGMALAEMLPHRGLRHVLVFSDGTRVNGSALVRGLCAGLPSGVAVSGGLSADGDRFDTTLVVGDQPPRTEAVACLGLYGEHLGFGFGSLGGWDPFGPRRRITRSRGNDLLELDGQPALALYRKYLGEHAEDLPAAGLLFPLRITMEGSDQATVRTILGVDDRTQSMTFAGDIPEGGLAQLMKANFDRLIDGAHGAAQAAYDTLGSTVPDLALLVSCVGRRLVLKQRTEEELEAVRDVLGRDVLMTGFYSYGEISPVHPGASCELHNQTMTITTIREAD